MAKTENNIRAHRKAQQKQISTIKPLSDSSYEEFVASLSEKQENRRAATVWQWETVRRSVPQIREKAI